MLPESQALEVAVADTPWVGKKAGVHTGRVAIRKTGSFNIQTSAGVVQGIGYRHCRLLQRADGYGYFFNKAACDTAQKREQVTATATGASHSALYLPGIHAEVSRAK